MQKLYAFTFIFILVFLAACSGPPMKLKRTSEKAIVLLNAELSNVNEFSQINDPTIVDMLQISDTEWCLVHKITNDIFFASLWQKVDSNWEQIALEPYVDNCNWAQ